MAHRNPQRTRGSAPWGNARDIENLLKFRVKEHYSTGDLAAFFGSHPRYIIKMIDLGGLEFWRVPNSRYRRVPHSALKEWLKDPDYWFFRERLEWAEKLAKRMNVVQFEYQTPPKK